MNSPELKEISILCKKILSKIVIGINKSLKKYHPKRVIQGGSNISKPTNKLLIKSSPNDIDNYEQVQIELLLKIVQASYKFLIYFVNSFLAMISNIVASQSIPENDNRENKQKLADVAKILKNITDDPEAMNNIELIAQLTSRILFELLNILEPEFEESIKRINLSMRKLARDMGIGIGTSMWTFAGTFIEAIPFWGFFVNMFITTGTTLNTASRIYRTSTIINLPIIEDAANTIERVIALINKYKKDIDDMINLIASYGNNNTLAEQKIRNELKKNVGTSLNALINAKGQINKLNDNIAYGNNILEEKKKNIANISNIATIELQNAKNPITLPIQRLKPIKMGGKNKSKNIKKYKIRCENRLVKTLKRFINPII
jgi:hypothetical protein